MGIFNGIPPNAGHQSLQAGFKAAIAHAQQIKNGRPGWALCEMGIEEQDSQWLFAWAKHLEPQVVGHCLVNPCDDKKQAAYTAMFGTLLTMLAVEYARVGLPQMNDWPLPVCEKYAPDVQPMLFEGDHPRIEQLRAIQLAVKKLLLKSSDSANLKTWLRETLALQFISANESAALPRWIHETIDGMNASNSGPARDQIVPAPIPPPAPAEEEVLIEDIFGRLEARMGVVTIEEGALAILDRAREMGLGALPWSLAEIRPTEFDYIWLRVWVKRLDENAVRYCDNPFHRFRWAGVEFPLQAALGLLLMLWISESARREAEEGWLWHWVPQDAIDSPARRLLFVRGQPTSAAKELLETAARRFNLRHVFGRTGAQQWIDTIFLQFGFTRRGFERRLPDWLAGQTPTQSIQQLIGSDGGSAEFQGLWETLKDYRQRRVSRDRAFRELKTSPWILPEWSGQILEVAIERNEGDGAASSQSSEPEDAGSFLTPTLLRWDAPAAPYFICQLTDLGALGLTEDVYELTIDGRPQTSVTKNPDGSYAAAQSELLFPFEKAHAIVRIVGRDQEVAAVESVELWPAVEDVVIFQLKTGRRLADSYADRMSPQHAYAALVAPDLQIEPQPSQYYSTPKAKLFSLPAGWSSQLCVLLGADVLWAPSLQDQPAVAAPVWTRQVMLRIEASFGPDRFLRWGDRVSIRAKHPPDVVVRYVRRLGEPVEYEPLNEQSTRIGPITLRPEDGLDGVQLQLGLMRQQQTHTVRAAAEATVVGAAQLRKGVWNSLSDRHALEAHAARSARFKIAPPRKWDGEERKIDEWALMEGDLWLRRLSRNHVPIGEVTGLGASLTIRCGPYNADRDVITVAERVVNHGVIVDIRRSPDALSLFLTTPIKPGERHQVVCWAIDGRFHWIKHITQATENPYELRCPLPENLPDFAAVALLYNNQHLGVWHHHEWISRIKPLAEIDAFALAFMVRWLRLPLLTEDALPEIREIAEPRAVPFLQAWLEEEDRDPFNLPSISKGWLAAVRTVFLHWSPTPDVAGRVLAALIGRYGSEDPLQYAAWRLLKVDPRLLYKTLIAWAKGQQNQTAARECIHSLRLRIAETNDAQYSRQYQCLLEEGAREWSVDSNFINAVIKRAAASARGERLPRRDEMNIALALGSESLRRLLAMALLKSIA